MGTGKPRKEDGSLKETKAPFDIYLITDGTGSSPSNLITRVEEALAGGIGAVQLREKGLCGAKLLTLARQMRELTARYNAKLLINDRVDIALLSEADGVHLGHGSMPPEAARSLLGPKKLIGVSTHSLGEAKEAQALGADFIVFGPVYHTASKAAYGRPAGVKALKETVAAVRVPVYGLGGIDIENTQEVLDTGCAGVALISAILSAPEVRKSAEALVEALIKRRLKDGQQGRP
ncbi:MAG: thiamine phosphate synthase [Deltaproteobacteria bacterium]